MLVTGFAKKESMIHVRVIKELWVSHHHMELLKQKKKDYLTLPKCIFSNEITCCIVKI